MNKDDNLTFFNIYRDINTVHRLHRWWTIKENRYQSLIFFQSGKNIHDNEFIIILQRPITMEHAKCQQIINTKKGYNITVITNVIKWTTRWTDFRADEWKVKAIVAFVKKMNFRKLWFCAAFTCVAWKKRKFCS